MKTNASHQSPGTITTLGNINTGHYYWLGNGSDGVEHYAGQTFKATQAGYLKTISIFSEMIVGKADVSLSVYEFDAAHYEWKEKKAECRLTLDKAREKQWIPFSLDKLLIKPAAQYAFKLSCHNGGMMAIAESAWQNADPYPNGEEWIGSSKNPAGKFHRHFDLSFLAEIELVS